jgi:hypothetical protein
VKSDSLLNNTTTATEILRRANEHNLWTKQHAVTMYSYKNPTVEVLNI